MNINETTAKACQDMVQKVFDDISEILEKNGCQYIMDSMTKSTRLRFTEFRKKNVWFESFSKRMDYLVRFATGAFPLSGELQSFGMAVQGAMLVRKGPNKAKQMHWFHAFVLSMLGGFSGGWLGFVWMGRPSSMLSNDLNFASCILAFILVNYTPFDIGFYFCNTLPVTLITTVFTQLFKAMGIMGFVRVCFATFKDNPSEYYPIPVFGPILYATLLGNMSGLILKGLEGHVGNGMPWAVQNGIFCASFYHFYVNDTEGFIGKALRGAFPSETLLGIDEASFAAMVVTYFMQIMGILQLPEFLGPSFTPFGPKLLNPWKDSSSWTVGQKETEYSKQKKNTKKTNGSKQKKS